MAGVKGMRQRAVLDMTALRSRFALCRECGKEVHGVPHDSCGPKMHIECMGQWYVDERDIALALSDIGTAYCPCRSKLRGVPCQAPTS